MFCKAGREPSSGMRGGGILGRFNLALDLVTELDVETQQSPLELLI